MCNLWSQKSEISLLGPKQVGGGCVPPGLRGRPGLCLFSFWRRLHSWLTALPPPSAKPVESASPSQAARVPSWLGELLLRAWWGLDGAFIPEGWNSCHTCRASGSRCCGTDVLEPALRLR